MAHAILGILEKFADRWEAVTETGCFIWTRALGWDGYGSARYMGKQVRVHRQALIEAKGPPPLGTEASHICQVRACVNPAHLVWETVSENHMRKSPEVRKRASAASGEARRKTALGCTMEKRTGNWVSRARRTGKIYNLGTFTDKADAIAAYDTFTGRKIHG